MKTIEWAAGLFEGEGCITTADNGRYTSLQLEMTDEDIVDEFAKLMGYGNVRYKIRKDHPEWKPTYRWTCQKKDEVVRILDLLLPYLGLRRGYKALNCLDNIELNN